MVGRLIVLGLFALVLWVPFAWRPPEAKVQPDAVKLVAITPHNEQIRAEFERGFSEWHEQRFGQPVKIDWRSMGTSDMRRLLLSEYQSLADAGREDEGAGYDIIFGGGDYEFDRKLKPGVIAPVLDARGEVVKGEDGNPKRRGVSILQPISFEDEFLREVFPQPMIADKPLYDPDGYWWGAALSSFGIVYNRDVLKMLDLPEPQTWSDLTDPRYFGWVALADPAKSGSVNVTYEAIVQRYGYERGWKTMRRVCGNARYFADSSSKVPLDVSAGEAAAGMAIDFYGRYQAQVVGGQRVGYVAPKGATIVNPDPIGMARGAPHPQLAERFIRFVLSREGQALWNFRIGQSGGPQQYELRRSPIRRDLYQDSLPRMVDQTNPFDIAEALPPNTPFYLSVVPTVVHAMAIDIHDDLKAAWRAINQEKNPDTQRQMLALFDRMPFDQQQLLAAPRRWQAGDAARIEDRLEWTAFFRGNYRMITQMSGQ